MKKYLKLIIVLLALALTVTALAISVSASDSQADPALKIKNLSVSLENAIFMNFKVESTGIDTPEAIELLLWKDVPTEYKKGSEDVALSSSGSEDGTGYEVFKYTDIAAKNMTDFVYVCAYASVDGEEIYSSPAKFSVVMYAYMQKNASNPDEELVALIDGMLDYGALAQTYFKHNTEFLANETTYQIKAVNGLLEDNFSLGWYFEGQGFTLTASTAPDGYKFSHWENSAGENIGDTEVLSYTATKNDTYTAVYEKKIPESSEGLEFSLNANGESYTVIGLGTCTDTEIVISTYNGLPVTAIGDSAFEGKGITGVVISDCVTSIGTYAFKGCKNLTSVTIPDSVTSIGIYTFNGCSSLATATIGNSVTSIGYYAFGGCSSLTSVTIPDSVTSIDAYAFNGCSGLATVTIGNAVTSIGADAFSDCTSLVSVTIPDSVTSIGTYAFKGCSSLASITIGNGVTSIADYAFFTCSSLTSITVSDNNTSYKSIDGNLYSKDGKTLIRYAIGKEELSFTIPDSVTSIADYAFHGCDSLASVTIPDSVTSINSHAFHNCTNLKNVTIPSNITGISGYTFYGCASLTTITIPDGVTSIGTFAFYNCINLKSVTIGNNVKSIGDHTFRGCSGLTSVIIPDRVTSIGKYAFEGCISLATVSIGNGVTSIGSFAFDDCTNLTSVNIPDGVTSIGNSAFWNCSSLTSVIIPDSVTSISYYAFDNCKKLTIYCEAESQPSGWHSNWNSSKCPVVWGYKAEE